MNDTPPGNVALTRSGGYPFARLWAGGKGRERATGEIEEVKLLRPPVERAFYAVIRPLVAWLQRTGIRPNTLTTIGTAMVLVSAVGYGLGWIRFGGAFLLLSGVVDTLDGQVARNSGQETKFGAFFDSTLDRVGDGATFIGIATYLLIAPDVAYRIPAVVLSMVAILASLLVSYARARAEGLGLDCKVGIAQRAERIVGLGVASVVVGAGPRALVLEVIVGLLALASVITVVQRFLYVYRTTNGASASSMAAGNDRPALDTFAKGR